MQLWRNLSIKYKLGLGIGALALITVFVCLRLSGEMNRIARHYQDLLSGPMTLALQAEDAGSAMLTCRRHEKDFLVRLETKYIEAHEQTATALLATLATMEQSLTERAIPDLPATQAKAAIKAVTEYQAQFKNLAEAWTTKGLDHESGLRGTMRDAVHDVEDLFERINEPPLMVRLLMLRRHEKDYFIRGLEKYPQAWAEELAALRADLARVNLKSSARAEAEEGLTRYEAAFGELQAQDVQIAQIIEAMRQATHASEPILQGIHDKALAFARLQQDETAATVVHERRNLLIISVVVAVLFVLLAASLIGAIVGPLGKIMVSIHAIEAGDLTAKPAVDGKDEIGKVAGALTTMMTSVATSFDTDHIDWDQLAEQQRRERARIIREREEARILEEKVARVQEVMEAVCSGDLCRDIDMDGEDAMARIAANLRDLLHTLRNDLTHINSQADVIAETSDTLDTVSDEILRRADHNHGSIQVTNTRIESVTSNLQSVAGAIEEMNACISEIAKNAEFAERVAETAVQEAGHSAQVIAELERHGNEISAMADEIGKVAEQTNLLSLNASIEAERAGVSGKGFRVVAYEVKELAHTTGKTTDKIRVNVNAIRKAMSQAVTSVDKINATIQQIFEVQRSIAGAVEEQSATTNEIQQLITQTAGDSEAIRRQMNDVETNADQTKNTVNLVNAEVTRLATLSTGLHQTLAKFTLKGATRN